MRQLLLLLSFLLIISCENSESGTYSTSEPGIAYEAYDDMELEEMVLEETAPDTQATAQKIIKTGNLRFETQDMAATHAHILNIIKNTEGYIQNDNSGKESYGGVFQNLTVRIPTRNFQLALDGISKGVAYFDEKTISQKDVTEEFVDLNARLKAKRALEDRYIDLLSKAKNVKEMLEIEGELAEIREEIEAKQGRLKYLQSQVSLSTLHIYFYKNEVTTQVTNSYGSKMINALKSGWNGVSVFFLGLLHLWPFLILLSISAFFVRRWMKKKHK